MDGILQATDQPVATRNQVLEQATAANLPSDEDCLSDDEPVSPQEHPALRTAESSSSSPVFPVLPSKTEAQRPAGVPTSQLPAGPSQEAAASAMSVGIGVIQPASGRSAADLLQDRAAAAHLPPNFDDIKNDEEEAIAQVGAGAQRDQAAATAVPPNGSANDEKQANHKQAAVHSQNGKDRAEQQRRDQAAAAPLPSDDDDDDDSGSFKGTPAASHAPMRRISWPMSTQSAESAHAEAEQTSAGHGVGVSDPQQVADESESEEESAGSTSAIIHEPPGMGSVARLADNDSEDSTSASAMTPPGKQEPLDQAGGSISSTSVPATSAPVRSRPFGQTAGAARQARAEETLAESSSSIEAPAGITMLSQGATREPRQPVQQSASGPTSAPLFTSSAQSRPAPLFDLSSAPSGSKATTSAQTFGNSSDVVPVSFSMPAFGQSATLPAFGQSNAGVSPASGQANTSWSFGTTAASASALGQAAASSASSSSLTATTPSFSLSAPASASMPSIGMPSSFLPSADSSATAASGPSFGRAASLQAPENPSGTAGTGKRGAASMQPSAAFGNTAANQARSRQPSQHGALASLQGHQQVASQATEHASNLKASQGPNAQPMAARSTADDQLTEPSASFDRARQPAPLQLPEVKEAARPARPGTLQVPKPGTAVTRGPPSFSTGFPGIPSAQVPVPFSASDASAPEGSRPVQQKDHRASVPADQMLGDIRSAMNGSQALRQAANTRVASLQEAPTPEVPAPTPQLAGEVDTISPSSRYCLKRSQVTHLMIFRSMTCESYEAPRFSESPEDQSACCNLVLQSLSGNVSQCKRAGRQRAAVQDNALCMCGCVVSGLDLLQLYARMLVP